jgi:hypothetical protein
VRTFKGGEIIPPDKSTGFLQYGRPKADSAPPKPDMPINSAARPTPRDPSGEPPQSPRASGLLGELGVERDVFLACDQQNSYIGVMLLQQLFALEHNFIAKKIAKAHPDWSDEAVFQCAKLSVAAIQAKIHTIGTACSLGCWRPIPRAFACELRS